MQETVRQLAMDRDKSSLEDPIGWTEGAVKEYQEKPKAVRVSEAEWLCACVLLTLLDE